MRTVLVLGVIACAACSDPTQEWGGSGPQDPNGGALCRDDGDCGGDDVCAHTGQCYAASELRAVTAKWTINGAKANGVSCDQLTLVLTFVAQLGGGYGETSISYSPVACSQGQFFIDDMPKVFDAAKIEAFGKQHASAAAAFDDATGMAEMDLTLM